MIVTDKTFLKKIEFIDFCFSHKIIFERVVKAYADEW